MNMSYCRFENTLSDFKDCYDTLCRAANGEDIEISDSEIKKAKELIEMGFLLADELGFVTTDGEFDNEECDIFFERLKDGCL